MESVSERSETGLTLSSVRERGRQVVETSTTHVSVQDIEDRGHRHGVRDGLKHDSVKLLNKTDTCIHLSHNAGEPRHRGNSVCSPGVFPNKEAMLSIRYVCTRQYNTPLG